MKLSAEAFNFDKWQELQGNLAKMAGGSPVITTVGSSIGMCGVAICPDEC
jgi:hypothetical protein